MLYEVITFLYNAASARALENAGFLREGIMRRARKKGDQFFDTVVYSRVDESRV